MGLVLCAIAVQFIVDGIRLSVDSPGRRRRRRAVALTGHAAPRCRPRPRSKLDARSRSQARRSPRSRTTNVVPGDRALGEGAWSSRSRCSTPPRSGGRLRLVVDGEFREVHDPARRARPGQLGRGLRGPAPPAHARARADASSGGGPAGTASSPRRQGVRALRHRRSDVAPGRALPGQPSLSQILERAVAMAGVRAGPASLEGARVQRRRAGVARIVAGLGSLRRFLGGCASPSRRSPGSRRRRPTPGSTRPRTGRARAPTTARGASRRGGSAGALVSACCEWARTATADGFFVFHSVLAEGAVAAGPAPSLRAARAQRAARGGAACSPARSARGARCSRIRSSASPAGRFSPRGTRSSCGRGRLRYAPFVEGVVDRDRQGRRRGIRSSHLLRARARRLAHRRHAACDRDAHAPDGPLRHGASGRTPRRWTCR